MPSILFQRDITGDVKSSFSSWDKCMAKVYCKWPVIVAIIIVSGIILSLIFCIARCVCCGAECACCCFKCCTSCCPSGGGRKGHKRMGSAPPPSHQPYQPAFQPQHDYAPAPINTQYRSPAPPIYERPQYATFDASSKPTNEDSLPAMPSWGDATSKKVEETVMPEKPGDVEMDRLEHTGGVTGPLMASAIRSPARSPVHRSPTSPLDYQSTSYSEAGSQRNYHNASPHNQRPQYGDYQDNYRGTSPVHSSAPAYATAGAYAAGGAFRQEQPASSGP